MKLIGSHKSGRIIRVSPKRATGAVPILESEIFVHQYGACHIVALWVTIDDISAAIYMCYRLIIDDDYLAPLEDHRDCQQIVA
jgi:hypothetical protein